MPMKRGLRLQGIAAGDGQLPGEGPAQSGHPLVIGMTRYGTLVKGLHDGHLE